MKTHDKKYHSEALCTIKKHHIKRFISSIFTEKSAYSCKILPILIAISLTTTHAAQLLDEQGRIYDTALAESDAQKARGLMYRAYLHRWQGMLFRFTPPQHTAFWMYRTYIPLSISFYDTYGQLITHYPHVPPCYHASPARCPSYPAYGHTAYVLETRPAHRNTRPPYAPPAPPLQLIHITKP